MNAFHHRSSARSLLLLVLLAMLLQIVGGMGLGRPAKDRFDFSSAICTTGTANATSAGAINGLLPNSEPSQQEHASHGDCPLCCGGNALVFIPQAQPLPVLALAPIRVPLATAVLPASLSLWAPHAARAPPQNS